jgi:predicted RNA-binding Zn-ribbon protein involved in translation (DUF1610 family)
MKSENMDLHALKETLETIIQEISDTQDQIEVLTCTHKWPEGQSASHFNLSKMRFECPVCGEMIYNCNPLGIKMDEVN